MKFLVLLIAIITGSVAFGRDCSLPNLNACLQQVLPACPQATIIIPPGAKTLDLTDEQKGALECRGIYLAKCFRVTVIDDLNLCAAQDAGQEAAPSPSPSPSASPDKSSSRGVIFGAPVSNAKGDCDKDDDDSDDTEVATVSK